MTTIENSGQIVLVIEDNPFNRNGLVMYLHSQGYGTLEAGDQRTAIEIAARELPPLAIVDIVLPERPDGPAESHLSVGLDVVRVLKQMNPNIGIVIFSAHEDRGAEVWTMVRDGMRGIAYLLKGNRAERILAAMNEAANGNVLLEPDMTHSRSQLATELRSHLSELERPYVERAAELLKTLTPQQTEVAQRVAASHTNQSIALAMDLAPKTIESYVVGIYRRLGLNDVDEKTVSLRKSMLLAKAFLLDQLTKRR